MNRRHFLISLTAAAVRPGIAAAQSKVYRIGSLSPVMPFVPKSPFGALLSRGFTAAGYAIDGSLVLIPRGSNGQSELLPRLAQELADAKVDAILATGYPAAVAAKQTGLPTVVTHAVGDPVATGLIASLARPGGNVTGISDNATELLAKRLQILKQVAPGIKRVAMLWNKNDRAMVLRYEASAKAADVLGVSIQPLGVGEPDDFGEAFNAMESSMPDAILMVADSLSLFSTGSACSISPQLVGCRPCTNTKILRAMAACCRTGPISPNASRVLPPWPTASSKAPTRPICPSSSPRVIGL
ncbi:putative ABC transport system substrate-binding protein [Bradyrhizobium sp. LM3.4]